MKNIAKATIIVIGLLASAQAASAGDLYEDYPCWAKEAFLAGN